MGLVMSLFFPFTQGTGLCVCQNDCANQLGTALEDGHRPRFFSLSLVTNEIGLYDAHRDLASMVSLMGLPPKDVLQRERRMRESAPPMINTVSMSTREERSTTLGK